MMMNSTHPPPFELVDRSQYYIITIASCTVFFGVIFSVTWRFAESQYAPEWLSSVFTKLEIHEQCNFCGLVCSTIHGIWCSIAVPIFLATTKWSDDLGYAVDDGVINLRYGCFCVTVAYFAADGVTCMRWCPKLTAVWLIHHAVGCVPYTIALFYRDCRIGQLHIAMALLCENAAMFLNMFSFSKMLGFHKSHPNLHEVWVHATSWSWFGTRMVLPVYVIAHLFDE